jgi:hypothetical protein
MSDSTRPPEPREPQVTLPPDSSAPISISPASRGSRPSFPPESRRARLSFPPESRAMRPSFQLVQMALSFGMARSIYAAAEIGLIDLLVDGPKTAEELAVATGTHAPSLQRLLRYLCSIGLCERDGAKRFSVTYLGSALQSGAPGAARSFIRAVGCSSAWASWGEIVHSLKTGQPSIEKATGASLFEFLSQNPDVAALFNDSMAGLYGPEAAAVAMAYDFSGLGTIVDVGGGTGRLLTTILRRFGDAKGVLFDLPHVAGAGRARVGELGLEDRCRVIEGDFFAEVPAGGDAYILSHVIHDWDDDRSLAILGNIRKVMAPSARLLVVESVILEDDNLPDPGKLFDISMLVFTGGMERTADEYAALFGRAGLRLNRVVPTHSASSVIEAVPA